MNIITKLLRHNWIATVYFNFKMLPFKQAIHLPIDFYSKVKFVNLRGKVILSSSCIHRGMVKIGAQGSEMFPSSTYVLDIKGTLTFNGICSLGNGGLMRIEKNGTIYIGDNVTLGAYNLIFCEKSIKISRDTISSWNCQIMDTDTHSIIDIYNNTIYNRNSPICIGERNWIGNHVIINKGTITPNDTIIASCTLCNKDYSKLITKNSIIGGYPARLLSSNKRRLNDKI